MNLNLWAGSIRVITIAIWIVALTLIFIIFRMTGRPKRWEAPSKPGTLERIREQSAELDEEEDVHVQ